MVTNSATSGPSRLAPVTPDDDTVFDTCRMLWVSVAGNVAVSCANDRDENGDLVSRVIPNVPVGWLAGRFRKVWSTGTTATVDFAGY